MSKPKTAKPAEDPRIARLQEQLRAATMDAIAARSQAEAAREEIERMRLSSEERLIVALADLIAGPDVTRVKHIFYRTDETTKQISVDMHGEDA